MLQVKQPTDYRNDGLAQFLYSDYNSPAVQGEFFFSSIGLKKKLYTPYREA